MPVGSSLCEKRRSRRALEHRRLFLFTLLVRQNKKDNSSGVTDHECQRFIAIKPHHYAILHPTHKKYRKNQKNGATTPFCPSVFVCIFATRKRERRDCAILRKTLSNKKEMPCGISFSFVFIRFLRLFSQLPCGIYFAKNASRSIPAAARASPIVPLRISPHV